MMASPSFHATPGDKIARMREQLAAVEAAIHKAYARWMELETLKADGEE